ncbi:hypothetical protein [Microvirga lotononidis]|uniref:Uncharacterized protein n=1 Tax=Microvirga lotononidis TaxID=864069 RepID=I4YSE1_9HYPH|nr:hypothetical protein [Microvirga lotononidis]EIM26883.1 hypothetical protein MicloDRAFT_00034340 [Microvirga lotononidis]WQO31434.1 hypothetical protein U0023_34690 [Microvirga lotononidis]
MGRLFTTLGVSVVAFGTLIGSVEAKTVFYEINGQRYSYDTSNRKQAAAARKQIETAKAAEAAQAKAAAERASNPLAALFGSQTQREAAEAQAQLAKFVSDQQLAAAASKDQRSSRASKHEDPARSAEDNANEPAGTTGGQQAVAVASVASPQSGSDSQTSAEPVRADNARKAAIKSVFLDAETGIKTIIRTDGSIQEELFDPGILSKLDPEQRSARTASNVVGTDPLPKSAPGDMTGSIGFQGAALEPGSRSDIRGRSLTN